MLPIPAIDIMNGQCVRLTFGDYSQKTEYQVSPLKLAKEVEEAGFPWLHIVDLDRAKNPENKNTVVIENIAEKTKLNIQTGGGIRNEDDIHELLEAGVKKVVIGSLAVKQPEMVKLWIKKFGAHKIIIAADAKDEYIAYSGWQESSNLKLKDFCADFLEAGAREFLCTDIAKDGALQGPNVELYTTLKRKFPQAQIIASGGVASLKDIQSLQEAKIDRCVVGKALFENRFSLEGLAQYLEQEPC